MLIPVQYADAIDTVDYATGERAVAGFVPFRGVRAFLSGIDDAPTVCTRCRAPLTDEARCGECGLHTGGR